LCEQKRSVKDGFIMILKLINWKGNSNQNKQKIISKFNNFSSKGDTTKKVTKMQNDPINGYR